MKGIYSNQFSGDPTVMEGEGVTTRCDFIMMTVNRLFVRMEFIRIVRLILAEI